MACAAPSLLGRARARLLCGASSLGLSTASAVLVLGIALSGEARAQTTVNPIQNTTYNINPASNPIIFGAATNIDTTATPGSYGAFGGPGPNWNVTNSGSFKGGRTGIYLQTPSSVTNAGTISGTTGYGVVLFAGGSVTNQAGAAISGGVTGVYVKGAGTVTNAGTITGTTKYGVWLRAGGGVTNQAGGAISGGVYGVYVGGAAGTVTNAGSITGTNAGVYLARGGSVTNLTGGTISGAKGVSVKNVAGAVTNAGTITGTGSYGVYLGGGGSVSNQTGGTISGRVSGVYVHGAAGTLTNAGTITGTNNVGVRFDDGGSVTNQAGGAISGGVSGVYIANAAGTVTNAGTITGTTQYGVFLQHGGSVINQNGGTISGGRHGVYIAHGAGTVTNAGTINGAVYGVFLHAGGNVTNSGTISGNTIGAYINGNGGDTITNAGTITGNGGDAVFFEGTGAKTLILQTGSVLNGNALGSTTGGAATNALILQGTGAANNNFLNFNSLDVQAGGVWALNGVSAIGTTTISGGTLLVGNAAHPGAALTSAVTVNAGATLAGQGTVIGNVTVLGGGTVAPGAASPFATLNVTGNATFANGSFYRVNLNGAGQTDMLVVGGTATLTGGSVQPVLASAAKRSYDILHATGGLGGTTFSGVNLTGFSVSLSYTATDVFLNLTAAQLGADSGLGRSQQNVATAINNFFNAGGTLPPGFVTLFGLTGGNLANALSQNSGEAATGAQQAEFQLMSAFLGLMTDPSIGGRGGFGADGAAMPLPPERAALPKDIALKAPVYQAPSFEQRWNVWGSAFGGTNRTNGDPVTVGSHDVSASAAGVAAGLDYHLTRDTLIGFALAGGGTSWSLAQNQGGGRSDAFMAGIYGKTHNGPAYLAASFAAANHWMSTDRFAFGGDHLTANFNGQSFGGRVEGGYRFAMPIAGVTPYAAVQVQSFHAPGYSETDVLGGGFGLAFAARSATDTRSELGSRFYKQMVVSPDAVLALRARAAWAHDWVSDPMLTASFQALPGASFIVNGAIPAKDSALTSVGAELRYRNGWSLMAKFDGELASRAQTYAGTGTVRYSW
jgi:uncharacterized protein with beta-barrel porin domain